jgi:hypothetical protein
MRSQGVRYRRPSGRDIDVLLEQVRGEAVSQRVWRNPIGQSSQIGGHVADAVELSRRHRVDAVAAGPLQT